MVAMASPPGRAMVRDEYWPERLAKEERPLTQVGTRNQTMLSPQAESPMPTQGATSQAVLHALTVDVEDYFHVSAFRHVVSFRQWPSMESRVERNTHILLELLAEFGVRATFFALGCVAESFPSLIRSICDAGHELGCHSYAHRLVYDLTPAEFRADTQRAMVALEDAAGRAVRLYRAPSFSITNRSAWALEVLLELGFTHDSSIFPMRHDLYGFSGVPRFPFAVQKGLRRLVEFPPPTFQLGTFTLPITGGGYLRLLPLWWQTNRLRALARQGYPTLLYLHPWELDFDQPRLPAPWRSRFRHYTGLRRTGLRLRRLLSEFRFGTLSQVLDCRPPSATLELSELTQTGTTASTLPTPCCSLERCQ